MLRRDDVTAAWQPAIWAKSAAAKSSDLQTIADCIDRWVAYRDDDAQGVIRDAMRPIIGPQGLDAAQSLIDTLLDELLADLIPSAPVDLVTTIAQSLPAKLVTTLLGCSSPDMEANLPAWSDHIRGFLASDQERTAAQAANTAQAIHAMQEAVRTTAESGVPGPLLRALLDAVDASTIEHEDAIANAVLLLFAGFETTSRLLGRVLQILVALPPAHRPATPDQAQYLVDFVLRKRPPVTQLARRVHLDTDRCGCPMRTNDMLHLRLDASDSTTPELLAFGGGRHACPGGRIGTAEAVSCVLAVATQLEDLHAAGPPTESGGRVTALPVRFRRLGPRSAR